MRFTEKQLCQAARRADEKLLSQLSDETSYQEYVFSETFEQKMKWLIQQMRVKNIKQKKVFLGWQYYIRNGVAVILLCFFLTCITIPNVVQAGYYKLIEVIETVLTEYTRYQYHSTEQTDELFIPVTFGYLPEGMKEITYRETETSVHTIYRNQYQYFRLEQRIFRHIDGMTYIIDTEDMTIETVCIGTEKIQLIKKNGVYSYVWLHEKYHIKGQSNLSIEEIIKILETITIE